MLRDLRINPRYDLQSSFVLISYEQTQNISGVGYLSLFTDQYPPTLPTDPIKLFNGLRFTVDLQGIQSANTNATLVCRPLAPTDPAWWLAHHPQYEPFDPTVPANAGGPPGVPDPDNPITAFDLIDGTIEYDTDPPGGVVAAGLPNELIDGQIAPWMNFSAQRITITARANITHRNDNVVKDHPITVQCTATNATSGNYSQQTISAFAEPVPIGLAKFLYDAVSVLQYEGELTLQEEDVSGTLSVGDLFNLTGGNLPEWATMSAMVQSITENLDTGATMVEFGPPRHLSVGELVDLLRINRARNTFYWPTLQTSGQAGSGQNVALGNNLPKSNSASTPGFAGTHVVSGQVDGAGANVVTHSENQGVDGGQATIAFTQWLISGKYQPAGPGNPIPTTPPGSVTISSADITAPDIAKGTFLKVQKVAVCQNGDSGTMYFLCSPFIPDP